MKRSILLFKITIFLLVAVVISPLSAKEIKRTLFLRNAKITVDKLPAFTNFSGEISVEKKITSIHQKFRFLSGTGEIIGTNSRRHPWAMQFNLADFIPPAPLTGLGYVTGKVEGENKNFYLTAKGELKNVALQLPGKDALHTMALPTQTFSLTATRHGTKENYLLKSTGEGVAVTISAFRQVATNKIVPQHFSLKILQLDLHNMDTSAVNLGNKLEKLEIEGKNQRGTIETTIELLSSLVKLSGKIQISEDLTLGGILELSADRSALGQHLKTPWLAFIMMKQLKAKLRIKGTLQKPTIAGIEWLK